MNAEEQERSELKYRLAGAVIGFLFFLLITALTYDLPIKEINYMFRGFTLPGQLGILLLVAIGFDVNVPIEPFIIYSISSILPTIIGSYLYSTNRKIEKKGIVLTIVYIVTTLIFGFCFFTTLEFLRNFMPAP